MKKLQTLIIILLCSMIGFAQNGINYKAIIKDDLGNVIANDLIQIQFEIRQNSETGTTVYAETHSPTTNDNGLIIVNIGEGALVSGSGSFDAIDWSSDLYFLNVQANIGSGLVDLGTTTFKTVPYALASGDNQWSKSSNGIYTTHNTVGINSISPEHTLDVRSNSQAEPAGFNLSNSDKSKYVRFFSGSDTFPDPSMTWAPDRNFLFASFDDNTLTFNEYMRISSEGNMGIGINPTSKLDVNGDIKLEIGTSVNEISTDETLASNSDNAIPTERAVKAYVDNANSAPVIFKVRGSGFALIDVPEDATVEMDLWQVEIYDTANAFNTTTRRFVVPETGHYFLHAYIKHSNNVSPNFVVLSFNVDTLGRYDVSRKGVDSYTEISGIFFLTTGQEVYLKLKNFEAGLISPDGSGSWFEGYKID